MNYRSEIDGLRAIAVVPVILFHAGVEQFSGGFVGVDIFFVISGYLITTIIINEMNQEKFGLLTFYERRARRILPALFFVILCSIPFSWYLLLPSDMKDFAQSLMAVSTFSSNILFWRESGYFDTAAELKPLLHTWSLAVEEQFYILFPLFLMATWRFGKNAIVWALIVIFVISLSVAHWGAYNKPSATFFLLPTRAWELIIGSFAAFYLQCRGTRAPSWLCNLLSTAGLAAILYSIFAFDETTPFPSLYALVPASGAVLIILFALKGSFVHTLLSLRGVVAVGLISYSLYLWHQPVFAFWRHYSLFEPKLAHMLALSLLCIPLSVFTYRFVETPFRRKAGVFSNRTHVLTAATFTLTSGVALGMFLNLGYLQREINYPLNYQPDREVLRTESWRILRDLTGDENYGVELNVSDNSLWFDTSDQRRKLLLVGNSHSKDLFNILHFSEDAQHYFDIARFGAQVRNLDDAFFSSPNYTSADTVMIASYYTEDDYKQLDHVITQILQDGKGVTLVQRIFDSLDTNGKIAADIIVQRCIFFENCDIDELETAINNAYYEEFAKIDPNNKYLESRSIMKRLREKFDSIAVLDRMEYVCAMEDSSCFVIDGALNKYFYDYGHHTLEGAEFFASRVDETGWLKPVLEQAESE